jgi:hypothetical protein
MKTAEGRLYTILSDVIDVTKQILSKVNVHGELLIDLSNILIFSKKVGRYSKIILSNAYSGSSLIHPSLAKSTYF